MASSFPQSSPDPLPSRPAPSLVRLALDAAVPGQEWAKHALEREAALLLRPPGTTGHWPVRARPFLFLANRPGTLPQVLDAALADHLALPFTAVNVAAGGFSVDGILASLLRRHAVFRTGQPPGVVLLTGLEHLSAAQACQLAAAITSREELPQVFRGKTVHLSPADAFWTGSLAVPEPSRDPAARSDPSITDLSVVSVGDGVTDIVAARLTSGTRQAGQAGDALLAALRTGFSAEAWLLPYPKDDLVSLLGDEFLSPLRSYAALCAAHGVGFETDSAAFPILAELALERGGTIDDLHAVVRQTLESAFPDIADSGSGIGRVHLTCESASGEAYPRLVDAPRGLPTVLRADLGSAHDPRFPEGLPARPARTPASNPEIRLASASDLSDVLAPGPGNREK